MGGVGREEAAVGFAEVGVFGAGASEVSIIAVAATGEGSETCAVVKRDHDGAVEKWSQETLSPVSLTAS